MTLVPIAAPIVRVGTEPTVFWSRDEDNDLPRFTVLLRDWLFRLPDGSFFAAGTAGNVGFITATVTYGEDDEPLVPSDEPPDIEHGFVLIAGWTIEELRTIALAHQEVLAVAAEVAADAPPQSLWCRLVRRLARWL